MLLVDLLYHAVPEVEPYLGLSTAGKVKVKGGRGRGRGKKHAAA